MELAVYGKCSPQGAETGCSPPLQVQTWSACERNYGQYAEHPAPDGNVVSHERRRVRGIDAAIFDNGHRVELYSPDVTIVIFAADRRDALPAAEALRGQIGGAKVATSDSLSAADNDHC